MKPTSSRLPHILQGRDRARAHQDIARLLRGQHASVDQSLHRITVDDPSLLIEELSNATASERYGVGHVNGTWFALAATYGCTRTVDTVFEEGGLHPEELRVFGTPFLWWALERSSRPEMLEIAFKRGADGHAKKSGEGLLLVAFRGLEKAMANYDAYDFYASAELVRQAIQKLDLVIDATGVAELTPEEETASPDGPWAKDACRTAVGRLLAKSKDITVRPDLATLEKLGGLLRKMRDCGASLDRGTGPFEQPPIVLAARQRNLWAVKLLIGLGAKTDDESLVRAGQEKPLANTRSLLDEVGAYADARAVAEVKEAILRRQLDLQARSAAVGDGVAASIEQPLRRQRAL